MNVALIGSLVALLCLWHDVAADKPEHFDVGTLTEYKSVAEAFRAKRGSCSCSTAGTQVTCSCCQKIVGANACLQLRVMTSGVSVKVTLAGQTILDEDLVGATGPGDFCVGRFGFTICFDFYNVDFSDLTNPEMCVKATASARFIGQVANVKLGCI